jgi:TolB-like protein
MALLNITVQVVDVKCGVTVWRDGFERDIAQRHGDFEIFL